VKGEAAKLWNTASLPISSPSLRFTIVYLCDSSPADIDNIIKPIQDALVGLVFDDDSLVSDVDSHRRFLADPIDVTSLPALLQKGVAYGSECVYVRVCHAEDLRRYL
jgi:crossover junction endodeoxyribonuclease RusA